MAGSGTQGPNAGLWWGWLDGESGWGLGGFNPNMALLDAVLNPEVISAALTAPPASPAEGDRYIVAAVGTGAWAGQDNALTVFRGGGWVFYAPKRGWRVANRDTGLFIYWSGSAWKKEDGAAPGAAKDFAHLTIAAGSTAWGTDVTGLVKVAVLAGETLSKVVFRSAQTNAASRVFGVVYADSAGVPGALLTQSPELAGVVLDTEHELVLATPLNPVVPTNYWIGLLEHASAFNVALYVEVVPAKYFATAGEVPLANAPATTNFAQTWAVWGRGLSAPSGGVDAPTDGKLYYRKGGGWDLGQQDISLFLPGIPSGTNALLARYLFPRAVTLPAGLVGSQGYAGLAATGATSLVLKKMTVANVVTTIGTVNLAAAAGVATFTLAADVAFAAGDRLGVYSAAALDPSAGDFSLTFVGNRS